MAAKHVSRISGRGYRFLLMYLSPRELHANTSPGAGRKGSTVDVELGGVALENALEAPMFWKQEPWSSRGLVTRQAKRRDSRCFHLVEFVKHSLFTDLMAEPDGSGVRAVSEAAVIHCRASSRESMGRMSTMISP